MRKVDPIGLGKCPEGYEYIRGYTDKHGIYTRPFCRKMRKTKIKMNMTMEYPGQTTIKATVKQGFHSNKISWQSDTEDIIKNNKQLSDALSKEDDE